MDITKFVIIIVNCLLGYSGSQVTNKDVSLGVRLLVHHLQTDSNDFTINLVVVKSFLAGGSIFGGKELCIPVVERLISFFVDDDNSTDNGETFGLDELKEVEVIELAGQVSNVKGWESLLVFSFGTLVLLGRI